MILDVFQQVPSEAWVGLAGVVFGSLLTTFGVSLTNKANLKHLKQQLEHEEKLVSRRAKKERLEELYVLVSHWGNVFFGNFLTLSLVMKGQIDYNSYLDEINASTKRDIDFNRIGMIVDIYGAELEEAYQAILDIRDEINNIELAHKEDYKHGKPGVKYLEPAANAQLKLGKACDNLKALVSTVARDV
ncbi:hypothetical protein [Pseudomonas sp. PAMC 25886]|uniref:hypothetical protein n=1 Tax=Pseudomonas sp. PAMC 25886 TaxID=1125977 RepID=UPI000287D9D6|nr:hypothetical protein [Pseudomonas sp. PAMC 25886]